MMKLWRRLALAAALYVTVGVGAAAAQTVLIRNAPPKTAVELVLNLATVASGTVDDTGNATLAVNLPATLKKQEADVNIYVDVCGEARRVLLAERGVQPPAAAAGCERHDLPGLFVLRTVTSMVVDVGGARPAVWLKQGPVPKAWLLTTSAESEPTGPRTWRPLPTGFVVFGGGGLSSLADVGTLSCGTVSDCSSDDTKRAFVVGADLWLKRFLGVEGSYFRPAAATAKGSGSTYRFNSSLESELFTVAGKVGIPAGPVRIYGKVGADYARATANTTETIDDRTVTVGGVAQVLAGGTQTWQVKTRGWGLVWGGGIEAWLKKSFALYAEGGRARMKGDPEGGGEAKLDENATYIVGGIRVHIGG